MRFILCAAILSFSFHLSGQESSRISLFDSLHTFQNIDLTLTYPFDSLYKSQNGEIDARITIRTESGFLLQHAPMTMNLRGKFRRMKCVMPPLMLNFKKSTLREMNLSSVDEIKLVTHCIEGQEGHDNLEEEYLIYQMYQSISPYAYRAIWLNVQYCDALNPDSCISAVAFLLEPDKVLSRRLGISEKKLFNLAEDSIDFQTYSTTTAFNFLIGNRDWSIVASRNAKLFFNDELKKYVVIPYDFDYSNVVGASYRRESLTKNMKHPYDRMYEGEYFKDKSGAILKSFLPHHERIQNVVRNSVNPMDETRRKALLNYFDEWFSMVKKEKEPQLLYGKVLEYKGGL